MPLRRDETSDGFSGNCAKRPTVRDSVEASMGIGSDGRGVTNVETKHRVVNRYHVKRSRVHWVLTDTLDGSMGMFGTVEGSTVLCEPLKGQGVLCETVEGSTGFCVKSSRGQFGLGL